MLTLNILFRANRAWRRGVPVELSSVSVEKGAERERRERGGRGRERKREGGKVERERDRGEREREGGRDGGRGEKGRGGMIKMIKLTNKSITEGT